MKTPLLRLSLFLISAFQLFSISAFSQGSLTPLGPPAPTMKRLDEVEPRTNLQANPAPPGVDTTNANYHFVINQPGSYYLSANLDVTKTNGVQINVDGVTLDLNGFQISRVAAGTGDGIQMSVTAHHSIVINGSVKGFATGINGINEISGARGCQFRNLSVSECISRGIFSGPGALLESCVAHDSSGTYGLTGGEGSSMTNCTALNNTVAYPISAAKGSTLINCNASRNNCSVGIFADAGSSLIHCNVFSNAGASGIRTGGACTITACTASSSRSSMPGFTAVGFDVGNASTIQGCTALNNTGEGIRLASGACLVRDNTCCQNLSGIFAASSGNRIEANNVVQNQRGIDIWYPRNVLVKNTASYNTTNYHIVTGNVFGAIVDRISSASPAVDGNSAPASIGTTDPWANVSY
jgi:parallel beta-helix repeat protein